jgi:2'-5' RNA ligase
MESTAKTSNSTEGLTALQKAAAWDKSDIEMTPAERMYIRTPLEYEVHDEQQQRIREWQMKKLTPEPKTAKAKDELPTPGSRSWDTASSDDGSAPVPSGLPNDSSQESMDHRYRSAQESSPWDVRPCPQGTGGIAPNGDQPESLDPHKRDTWHLLDGNVFASKTKSGREGGESNHVFLDAQGDQEDRHCRTSDDSGVYTIPERNEVVGSHESNTFSASSYHQSVARDELHVGLDIPKQAATEIYNWVQEQDWPESTELEPLEDYHITMLFAQGDGAGSHHDAKWIEHESHAVTAKGLKEFPPSEEKDGLHPIVLLVESDTIHDHHNRLAEAAEAVGVDPGPYSKDKYAPHMTIAYGPSLPKGLKPPKLTFETSMSSVSSPRDDILDDDDNQRDDSMGAQGAVDNGRFRDRPSVSSSSSDQGQTLEQGDWVRRGSRIHGNGAIVPSPRDQVLQSQAASGSLDGEAQKDTAVQQGSWSSQSQSFGQPDQQPTAHDSKTERSGSHCTRDAFVQNDVSALRAPAVKTAESTVSTPREEKEASVVFVLVPGVVREPPEVPPKSTERESKQEPHLAHPDFRHGNESDETSPAPQNISKHAHIIAAPYMRELVKFADSWNQEHGPLRDQPAFEPTDRDCTCEHGHKLDCPVHGMNADETAYEHVWDFPNPASPVGYDNADAPRTWMRAQAKDKVRKTERPHKCKYCKEPATKSLLWAEGMAFIPVCDKHEQKAREKVGEDEVCGVHEIKTSADQADTREMPDQMPALIPHDEPAQRTPHPEDPLGCTCDKGHKLDCPVHGLHATEQGHDHSWSIPESNPVGYPQDQPRNYMTSEGSVHDAGKDHDAERDGEPNEHATSKSTDHSAKPDKGQSVRVEMSHWHIIAATWTCPACGKTDNNEHTCKNCGYDVHQDDPTIDREEHQWHRNRKPDIAQTGIVRADM